MNRKKFKILVTIFCCCWLQACETFQPAEVEKTTLAKDAIEEAEKNERMASAPASSETILDSLLPPVSISEPIFEEKRFDLSVKNIDARSFLLGLVDGTPYNMIVSPEVDSKISLQLKDVTVSEVLRSVEKIYPLMIEKQGNMFFVSSAESLTRIYSVDYLHLTRQGRSKTNVAGQAVANSDGNSSNKSSGSNNSSRGKSSSSVSQINASEISTESSVNFWQELEKSLQLIIQGEEKASVIVSPHAGIVMVKALPHTQKVVQEYLGITQRGINRQVILEAKIIEVNLNEGFQAGIDWRKINTVNSGDTFIFGQQGQVIQQASAGAPLNGVFSMLYQGNNFDAAIDLLQTQGEVHVLSSPRVSTVNNQKAIIKVGSDEFFVTDVSTTTVTGTSTATTPDVTLTPFFSGISLDVTPQINANGEIVLHVHPVISEISDQQKTITLGQDEFTLPLALSNVRESDTIVRARDQQVIVIGGLMQTRIQKEDNSTPILGDIPVIGGIFNQSRDVKVKSELVILLKANIVDHSTYREDLRETKNRLNSF